MEGRAYHPIYLSTHTKNKITEKAKLLEEILSACSLCPRGCKINRLKGETGFCKGGSQVRVTSAFPHFGEESCLVGNHGSGTIFFSYCNLGCVFCQNYEISHGAEGKDVSKEELSKMMLYLQGRGCSNINLVTPTHFAPQIVEALVMAIADGLNIPLVYNCGGYESPEVIDILDGIIDIYMPDAKFFSSEVTREFCQAPDYFPNLKTVLKKMHKQVGDLVISEGIARRGLLIRHLIMPEGLAGTKEIMRFIATEISCNTYVNVMSQYRPCGKAFRFARINRALRHGEFLEGRVIAQSFGLNRFD